MSPPKGSTPPAGRHPEPGERTGQGAYSVAQYPRPAGARDLYPVAHHQPRFARTSGTAAELLSAGKGVSRYTVEAEGEGVAEALSRLPGVDSHTADQVEGRTRVQLVVSGSDELRPEISRMANERQWVLWSYIEARLRSSSSSGN